MDVTCHIWQLSYERNYSLSSKCFLQISFYRLIKRFHALTCSNHKKVSVSFERKEFLMRKMWFFLQLMHVHEDLLRNIHTTTYSIPFIAVFHYFLQPSEWNFRSMPNQLGFICKLSRLCKIEKQFPAKYCFSCE